MARRRRNSGFPPYVPVGVRRARAAMLAIEAEKEGASLSPIRVAGRTIAHTFWGRAWCEYIESFHDYENRLARGKRYVRNGSVIDLQINRGTIQALVTGNSLYHATVTLDPCTASQRKKLEKACSREIGSVVELLEGRLSQSVMAIMTAKGGLLARSLSMDMSCSCPDWAWLCKHLAAVLYGVGARLDDDPSLLFTLRGLDPEDMVSASLPGLERAAPTPALEAPLADIFGIQIAEQPTAPSPVGSRRRPGKKKVAVKKKKARPKSRSPVRPGRRPGKKPRTSRVRTITRQELLERGVPAGTIGTWLRQGVLAHSGKRAVYRLTAAARSRLLAY